MVIHVDSREQKNKHILDHFNEVGQDYIVSKAISGDYIDVNNNDVIIDLKQSHGDGLAELCANLTRTTEHIRLKKELERAKFIGCKRFIFLIVSTKITCLEDVNKWVNKRGQVAPETLQKIMTTFKDRYKVEYIFCKKKVAGEKIIELLSKETGDQDGKSKQT